MNAAGLTLPPAAGAASDAAVAFAAALIDRSGKAPVIEAALAHRTGRPRPLPVRAVLTALLCLALDDRPLFLTEVTRLLFCQISGTSRRMLGVTGAITTQRAFLAAYRRGPLLLRRDGPPARRAARLPEPGDRPGAGPGPAKTPAAPAPGCWPRPPRAGTRPDGSATTAPTPRRRRSASTSRSGRLGYSPVMDYRDDQLGIQAGPAARCSWREPGTAPPCPGR